MQTTVRQSFRSSREEDHHRRIVNHRKKNLEKNQIKITKLSPLDRNDQVKMLSKFMKNDSRNLKLVNAGTGSGKTRCMFHITDTSMAKIVAICAPNTKVQEQLYDASSSFNFTKSNILTYLFQDITPEIIRDNIKKNIKTVVFVSNIGSINKKYTKNSKNFTDLISLFPNMCVTIFDELDQQLTSLTGSAQPRTDINDWNISEFRKFYEKNICGSLNIFDVLRKHNIPAIGLSATLNNLICNKLALLGYYPKDISILNVHPIYELYNQTVKHVDTSNFDELVPYLKEAEETDINHKILLLFSCDNDIHKFKDDYQNDFSKEIDSIDITSKKKLSHDQLKKGISKSKYIIGIDMINTGFDVSTLVKDTKFALGIIFRDFNDKSSQPLSKNPKNKLSNETSASLLQAASRIRYEGLILMKTSHSGFNSLYEEHVKIFNIINEGYNEVFRYGYKLHTQIERYVHTLFISIIQNINEGSNSENRRMIIQLIADIKNLTGRDIESDLLDINIVKHNYNIYTDAIKRIWLKEIGIILPEAELTRVISNQTSHASNINTNAVETDDEDTGHHNSNAVETDDEQPVQNNSNAVETDDEDTVHHNTNAVETDDENEDEDEEISDITDSDTTSSPTINSSTNTLPSIHSSGNGYREGRTIDEKIKEKVIRRSKRNGICNCIWCSEGINTDHGDVGQIAHMKRHDRKGEYSLDNLGYAHRSCDAMMDDGYIIPDTERGGVWYHPRYNQKNAVDSKQMQNMANDNILDRLNWAKELKKRPTLTNIEFRKYLTEQGYVFKPLPIYTL
jgi:hypothetical protein